MRGASTASRGSTTAGGGGIKSVGESRIDICSPVRDTLEPSEAETDDREGAASVRALPVGGERASGTGVLFIVHVESREMNNSLVNDAPDALGMHRANAARLEPRWGLILAARPHGHNNKETDPKTPHKPVTASPWALPFSPRPPCIDSAVKTAPQTPCPPSCFGWLFQRRHRRRNQTTTSTRPPSNRPLPPRTAMPATRTRRPTL